MFLKSLLQIKGFLYRVSIGSIQLGSCPLAIGAASRYRRQRRFRTCLRSRSWPYISPQRWPVDHRCRARGSAHGAPISRPIGRSGKCDGGGGRGGLAPHGRRRTPEGRRRPPARCRGCSGPRVAGREDAGLAGRPADSVPKRGRRLAPLGGAGPRNRQRPARFSAVRALHQSERGIPHAAPAGPPPRARRGRMTDRADGYFEAFVNSRATTVGTAEKALMAPVVPVVQRVIPRSQVRWAGSQRKGTAIVGSDRDMCVESADPVTEALRRDLRTALEVALGRPAHVRAPVVRVVAGAGPAKLDVRRTPDASRVSAGRRSRRRGR